MIDKLQNIYNGQLSEISASLPDRQGQQSLGTARRLTSDSGPQAADSNARNSELKEVAKEMEAVFLYQLLKEMRKTSESTISQNGLGADTYMSMFDMEISKLFAERGLGLQDAVMRSLGRVANTADVNDSNDAADIPEPGAPEKPGLL